MNSVRRGCHASNAILLRLRHYSSSTRKSKSKFPKPTEIPFQPKLANSVNLIGTVHKPVHIQTSPDGNLFASTVITRLAQNSSSLLIPVVFQGDLAHTANFHLKQNDVVHVAGQLTTHPSHSTPLSQFQVIVESLNFVQDYPPVAKASLNYKEKTIYSPESNEEEINPSQKDMHSEQSEEHDKEKFWKDVLNNPSEWRDVQSTKESAESTAFERKPNGEIQSEVKQSMTGGEKKYPDSLSSSWSNLLGDPKQWWDYRDSKRKELVSPRYPDFKRKDGSAPIWIDRAPKWVLSRLQELEFDIPVVKPKQAKDGDQSWNDLVQNPAKWWDNRLNKKNERGPDFKHKETGEGLWLKDSPSWVLPKLPPLQPKQIEVSSN
ncbi:protein OSB2, chloroplastic-like isoform X2 [Cicer arietinum]|uniref:Protein OSB2, chloroplastic-like isoform X2 n=1 Tax=Cicer arietinum TaxID=3827 RepID=A0A1S3EG31_CICAR|nr:protein OSB2, chloroplastic-like isoform X2 [Cicer arietinum]